MYELQNPAFIATIGTAGTGKTETAKELCRKLLNTYWLNKELNMHFLNIRPTEQGELPPTEEIIKHYRETGRLSQTTFFNGDLMHKIDFHSEFNGRHTRDQMYLLLAHSAKENLELGKHPVLDALIIGRQLEDGTIPGLFS